MTDLVHLLAELLENATAFSSPQTKVRVTSTRLPDGRVVVEIHDKGIGLTAEDFADINHKLANPPTVDAAVSQRMGLFVVGRLVRPARHPGPAAPLRGAGGRRLAGDAPEAPSPTAVAARSSRGTSSRSRGSSRSRTAGPARASRTSAELSSRTAAELGFDDMPRTPGPGRHHASFDGAGAEEWGAHRVRSGSGDRATRTEAPVDPLSGTVGRYQSSPAGMTQRRDSGVPEPQGREQSRTRPTAAGYVGYNGTRPLLGRESSRRHPGARNLLPFEMRAWTTGRSRRLPNGYPDQYPTGAPQAHFARPLSDRGGPRRVRPSGPFPEPKSTRADRRRASAS
ncbi:hypothetical protein SANTM175S_10068 [Streptomyces antimycoticus]